MHTGNDPHLYAQDAYSCVSLSPQDLKASGNLMDIARQSQLELWPSILLGHSWAPTFIKNHTSNDTKKQ